MFSSRKVTSQFLDEKGSEVLSEIIDEHLIMMLLRFGVIVFLALTIAWFSEHWEWKLKKPEFTLLTPSWKENHEKLPDELKLDKEE